MNDEGHEQEMEEIRSEYNLSGGIRGKRFRAYQRGCQVEIHKKDGTVEEHEFSLPDGTVVWKEFPPSASVGEDV